ncbi:MAG TPA: TonB-dependent receptor [Bryobacteraceae bacterium]|nr:TonB-dependent receptor [Bryobacteraceae bacterium]
MRLQWGLVLFALFPALPVSAQIDGRIVGSVVDSSGAPVPGAEVELILAGGKKPLLTTKTSVDGLYHFIGVRPGEFDLTVASAGFVKAVVRSVSVDPARETAIPEVKLQLATVTQNVEVTAQPQGVVSTNAEISQTISMEEIQNLPILDRDPLSLIQTQPGVVSNGNSTTVINGLRTSYSDVTMDGINIQDNYIRDNALDYSPNKVLLSQVRELTLVTSNGNAALSGGATELAFSTPSGTNLLHGDAFWYNRNNAFSANDWFNNQAGVALPFLNQNQFGVTLGGPIRKDKIFFYGSYEAVRLHAQTPAETQLLTSTARQGIFSYRDSSGVLHQVNILNAKGVTADPAMQTELNLVPGPQFINDNLVGDGLNTGGYRFDQRSNETRDNVTGKIDYNISTAHAVSGSYAWNRDNLDRPDLENDYSTTPKAYNPNHSNFLALSWRWTPTARLTNEVRAGFNLTWGYFLTSQNFGSGLITGTLYSDPVNEFMPQGRTTNTYSVSDDASYQRGNHFIQFGFHGQQVKVRSYDDSGVVPVYGLAMGTGQPRATLQTRDLPGINATDLANANALLATLGGFIDNYSQTFNVTSRTSGFVDGAPFVRHFRMNDYALYVQDKWKIAPRLTATLGLRWDLPSVVDERDGLELQPVLNGTAQQTLLSNATENFVGSAVGRPLYHRDLRSFAPNLGVAWDVFGDGRTALRGGYSIFYVNDQAIVAPENIMEANAGLQGVSTDVGLSNRVSTGLPTIFVPTYQVPITVAGNYAQNGVVINPSNTVGIVDPTLHRPYVQQYSIGIQHQFKETVLEVRYVGNHGVGEYRSFDYNQVNINAGGFLQDFLRAQNNGNLALARNGVFNPAYNAAIPGSQQLPVFKTLSGGGYLTDPSVINLIQTGQAADLATLYQVNGLNGAPGQETVPFFAQPYALGSDILTNYSNSTYNSLQVEARHRMRSGLSFEANYTFSKVLSDADGDVQSRIQHFLDINNPKLERARANFDLTHMIKADGFYELPFGKNHRLQYKPLNRVIGGWTYSTAMTWQSGAPFSILSGYGTLNRSSGGRAYYNSADIAVGGSALANIVNYRMTGSGPMIIGQSAINPANGSGVANLGDPSFSGEAFFNPGAGTVGVLQRRMFSGPWTFGMDMSLLKKIPITEAHNLEFRMDAFNAFNHATFWAGDQNINSNTFGVMSSMFFSPRVMQFGLHYKF